MNFKLYLKLFFVVYVVKYTLPFPLNYLPYEIGDGIADMVLKIWEWLVPIFSKSILNIDGEVVYKVNGSGDSKFSYVLVLLQLILGLVISMILYFWLQKDKKSSIKVFDIFIVYTRYYLAFSLFAYGFAKVFYNQFHELSLFQLTQSFGDSSPMGLLWKFMGYSEAYNIFTGLIEVIGAFLLLFRNTKLLGALICFGSMIQVFMLNMTFDVPVKLYSFHLLLFSTIVLSPDINNMMNIFLKNKPTYPKPITPYFKKPKLNLLKRFGKLVFVCFVLYTSILNNVDRQKRYGKRAAKNILYGIYDVNLFIVNNDTIEPSRNNFDRWDRLIIDKNSGLIEKMNRERTNVKTEIDFLNRNLILQPYLGSINKNEFSFKIKGHYLILEGEFEGKKITAKMSKIERKTFFLEKRDFNWINEYPMNR